MKIFVVLEILGAIGLLICSSNADIISKDFTALVPVDGDWIPSSNVEATVISLATKDNESSRYISFKGGFDSFEFQNIVSKKSISRDLAEGDFDELLKLINNFVIRLPEFESTYTKFSVDAKLAIKNILCRDMILKDMNVAHNLENNQNLKFSVGIKNLGLTCEMDYKWRVGILSGEGNVVLQTIVSSASTELSFSSENFDFYPPDSSVTKTCQTNFGKVDLDFTGSMPEKFMNWLVKIIPQTIESEIADMTCEEFTSLSTNLVGDMVNLARERIDQYSLPSEELTSAENELEIATFSNTKKMGKLLQDLISDANSFFGSSLNSEELSSSQDLGINAFLRENILNKDQALELAIEDMPFQFDPTLFEGHDKITNTRISLDKIKIMGLDQLTKFEAVEVISNHTFQHHLNWDFLKVELELTVHIKPSTMDDSILYAPESNMHIFEHITIGFRLDNVDAVIAFLLTIDQNNLEKISLGSLLSSKNIVPCLFSSLHDVEMSRFNVSVEKIRDLKSSGFVSQGIDRIITQSVEAAFSMYENVIIQRVPSIFQTTIRNLVNDLLKTKHSESHCPSVNISASEKQFIDFRDLLLPETEATKLGGSGKSPYGDLLPRGYKMLKELIMEVDPATGLSKVNNMIIGPLSRTQSGDVGTFSFLGELIDVSTRLDVEEFAGFARLRIMDVNIENADTIGSPLSLMDALFQQPYGLNSSVVLGASDAPFRFSLRVLFVFSQDDGMEISNDVKVSFDLLDANIVLTAFVQILEDRFATFPIADLLDFNCWLAMIPAPTLDAFGIRLKDLKPSASITDLAVSLSDLKVKVECISCSSPGITELTESLSSPEATSSTNQLMKGLVDKFISGNSFVQMHIDQILNDAPLKCPHSPSYSANPITTSYKAFTSEGINDTASNKVLFQIVAVVSFLLAFITGLAFLVTYIVNRRHENWLKSLSKGRLFILQQFQHEKEGKELDLNTMTKSLFQSSTIPAFWRYAIPIVLVGNIAFFLSGHLSIGATVNIEGEVAGEAFRVEKFFYFSMVQSTIEMWEAGAKSLALLILVFSGIWPYSKTLITLVLWFLPPTMVSISRRGSILLWLDALAKWSMVDIFALIMSIVAFRISITSPDTAYLPQNFYLIDVMVVPLWGLYANMIAQLISQLSSHLIIHYHRKTVRNATRQYEGIHCGGSNISATLYSDNYILIDQNGGAAQNAEKQCDSLYNQAFSRPHRGENDKLVTRFYVNYLFCLVAIALVVFLFLGCYFPSFSVEILGLLGVVVESGQDFEEAIKNHNLFSMMKLLADEASFLNNTSHYFGLGTLISICFICVIIVPLVQAMALVYQWFFSMTKKTRTNLSIFLEILQAWQYSEVYIISVIVASWQFGPVSDFMINEYCDSFNDQLSMLDYFGFLDNKDVQCFQLQATIQNSTYFIAASAALLALMNTFVMKATKQYFSYSNNDIAANRTTSSSKQVETMFLDYNEEHWNNATEDESSNCIQPPPILFTDTFRWLLQREDIDIAAQSEQFFNNGEERTIAEGTSSDSNDQEQFSSARSGREELAENSESTSLSISLANKIDVLPSYYSDFEADDDNNTVESDDHTVTTDEDDNGNLDNETNK